MHEGELAERAAHQSTAFSSAGVRSTVGRFSCRAMTRTTCRSHTDASKVADPATAITAVYFMHRRPRGFSGGQLRFYDTVVRDGLARPGNACQAVEPAHDSIDFFPSSAFHEVGAAHCPSGRFADHRFTLTSWISGAPRQGTDLPGSSDTLTWMAQAAEGTRPLPHITTDTKSPPRTGCVPGGHMLMGSFAPGIPGGGTTSAYAGPETPTRAAAPRTTSRARRIWITPP